MRNPDRIEPFCKEFALYWKEYMPDMRFGQLMMNFLTWMENEQEKDPWFVEEGPMLRYLAEFFDNFNTVKVEFGVDQNANKD